MVHQCREGRTCSCGGRLGFRYLLVLGLSLLLFRGATLVSMGLRSHADTPASTRQQLRAHSEPQQPQLLQQRAEAQRRRRLVYTLCFMRMTVRAARAARADVLLLLLLLLLRRSPVPASAP